MEDSTCSVHASRGPLEPASPHLRSEVEIVCRHRRGHPRGPVRHRLAGHAGRLQRHPHAHLPGGARLRVLRGQRPPAGRLRACRTRRGTPGPSRPQSGTAEFVASPIEVLQVPDGHLVLQTLRSHDQFNTTIYGLSDRYRGIEGGRQVIFVHPDDITHLGFADGDVVDIVTHWAEDDRERIGRGIPDRRLRHAARFGRGLLPGDQPTGAAGLHRARQQHPDVEVGGGPAAATRCSQRDQPRNGQDTCRRRRFAQEETRAAPSLLTRAWLRK